MAGDAASIEIAKIQRDAQLGSANAYADASRFGATTQAGAQNYGSDTMRQVNAANAAAQAEQNALKLTADADANRLKSNTDLATNAILAGTKPDAAATMFRLGPSPLPSRNPNNMRSLGLAGPEEEKLYAQGTARVPGHGDGTVDTVDAKLAPGEAVLNKAAAEMLGRGLIDLLNKHGMLQMGMPEPDEDDMPQGEPQHHAAGCSSVRKYAAGTSMVSGKGGSGRVNQPGDLMDNHGREGAGWAGSTGTGRTGIFDPGGASGPAPSAGATRYPEPGDGGASGRGFDYAGAARTLRGR